MLYDFMQNWHEKNVFSRTKIVVVMTYVIMTYIMM